MVALRKTYLLIGLLDLTALAFCVLLFICDYTIAYVGLWKEYFSEVVEGLPWWAYLHLHWFWLLTILGTLLTVNAIFFIGEAASEREK